MVKSTGNQQRRRSINAETPIKEVIKPGSVNQAIYRFISFAIPGIFFLGISVAIVWYFDLSKDRELSIPLAIAGILILVSSFQLFVSLVIGVCLLPVFGKVVLLKSLVILNSVFVTYPLNIGLVLEIRFTQWGDATGRLFKAIALCSLFRWMWKREQKSTDQIVNKVIPTTVASVPMAPSKVIRYGSLKVVHSANTRSNTVVQPIRSKSITVVSDDVFTFLDHMSCYRQRKQHLMRIAEKNPVVVNAYLASLPDNWEDTLPDDHIELLRSLTLVAESAFLTRQHAIRTALIPVKKATA